MWLPLALLLLPTLSEWGGAEVLETQGVQVELLDERGRNDRLDINYKGFVVDAEREVGPRSWPWTVSVGWVQDDGGWVHVCSGSIVSESRVVTSAACIDHLSDPYYYSD